MLGEPYLGSSICASITMKPNSLVTQFLGACGVGVFIGRMSVSLPLELRLHEDNGVGAASHSLAVLWAESLSSPPLVLLELMVRGTVVVVRGVCDGVCDCVSEMSLRSGLDSAVDVDSAAGSCRCGGGDYGDSHSQLGRQF